MKAIGIDLGTTNSVVSIYEKGLAHTVKIFNHKVTPSVVAWTRDKGDMLVGVPAKKRVLIDPELAIVSNKRFMGNRDHTYHIFNKTYSPVEIASFILKYLKDGASETLGETIKNAVITVPAYFNQNQKEDTQYAAEQAGLNVLMLQAEPTAAAIAYGFNQEKDQTIVVYDLGGGTFDISILEIMSNQFNVKAIGGDSYLGGVNFDEAILDYLFKEIKKETGIALKEANSIDAVRAKQQLKELAEHAKIELSSTKKTELVFPSFMSGNSFECEISRNQLKELILPHLLRTVQIIRDTLRDAGLTSEDINRVVCVGGSTKSALISDVIADEIKMPHRAENVDEVVAMGAAITGASLLKPIKSTEKRPIELQATNVTPFNIGIRLENDKFGILIHKNATLPVSQEEIFSTSHDYATETEIVVFQGNNPLCSNNTQLGGFTLKGIQKAKAGIPKIKVCFKLNESDILEIEAIDLSTQKGESLVIEKFTPKPFENKQKSSLNGIKIGVSRVGCDDMGKVLGEMGFSWELIEDYEFSNYSKISSYDIIFINCCAGGSAISNKNSFNRFVKQGGVLYVSDLSAPQISEAFPAKIMFGSGGIAPQTVSARIVNNEVCNALKLKSVRIHFDLASWVPVNSVADDADIYLEATVNCNDMGTTTRPIMAGFSYGDGYVVYTAFHNHAQTSKDEMQLLRVIALKPISVATKTPLVELVGKNK